MSCIIRKTVREDLPELARIEEECIPEPWSLSSFEAEFSAAGALFLTAVNEDGGICGFITANAVLDEINIYNIAVRKAFRRCGTASELLRELMKNPFAVINLEVRESNAAAIALYEKCGFEQVGMRKGFYRNPTENALLMSLNREGKK